MDKAAGDTCLIRGFLTEGLSQVLCGRFFSVIAVLCLLGMGSRVTMAQTLGQRPYVAPEPIELGFVESATGNLHLEIPMGSFPQRASSQPMKYFMAYDSNFWTITPSNVWSPASPLPFAGWRTVAHQWQSITYNIYSILCLRQYNNFQAVDNVGTVHFFPVTTA